MEDGKTALNSFDESEEETGQGGENGQSDAGSGERVNDGRVVSDINGWCRTSTLMTVLTVLSPAMLS